MALPFPLERLTKLATIILPLAISQAIRMREDENDQTEHIWGSNVLNSYAAAYPYYLGKFSPQVEEFARFVILTGLFQMSDEAAQLRVKAAAEAYMDGDPMTRHVMQLALEDGTNYFGALIADQTADESATANLINIIRAL